MIAGLLPVEIQRNREGSQEIDFKDAVAISLSLIISPIIMGFLGAVFMMFILRLSSFFFNLYQKELWKRGCPTLNLDMDASEDFLQAAAAGSSWFSLSASLLFVIASCFLVMLSIYLDLHNKPPYVFKCLLYYLTGVPPERQKIMVKGGLLKDDADWSSVGVKQRKKLMMMGTADEVFKAPEKGTVFIEDLSEEEQVVALALPQRSTDNHL
ncbi:hypothetical protein REPUB_Repub05bG0211100 [Reevesia pubescens]